MFENGVDVYVRCNLLGRRLSNGQSAAKPRIEEGSTTIPYGSRRANAEMGSPKP